MALSQPGERQLEFEDTLRVLHGWMGETVAVEVGLADGHFIAGFYGTLIRGDPDPLFKRLDPPTDAICFVVATGRGNNGQFEVADDTFDRAEADSEDSLLIRADGVAIAVSRL